MQLLRSVCLVLTITACEHKNAHDDQAGNEPTGQPSPDPSPAARAKVEPGSAGSATGSAAIAVAKGSDATVAAPAVGGDMEVRAPVAADLATYVKTLPGNGTKLNATIETTLGTIHCELFGDKAPITVANFVGLATGQKAFTDTNGKPTKKPFFDGLTFHRVIPEFMAQGGDPQGSGAGGPGYQFQNEHGEGLQMDAGMLAMANAGPNTNGSQFFITEVEKRGLDPNYTIFGKCGDAEVVKKITHTPTVPVDKPKTPVLMTKVSITKS